MESRSRYDNRAVAYGFALATLVKAYKNTSLDKIASSWKQNYLNIIYIIMPKLFIII